jgi:hypothetical protein
MQSAEREKVIADLCKRITNAGPTDAPVPFSEVSAPQECVTLQVVASDDASSCLLIFHLTVIALGVAGHRVVRFRCAF